MLNILWVLMIAGGILFASFHGTMGKLTEVFISSSTEAVNLCIFMLGVIGVWNGMMEIAVKSGLMKRVSKAMYPFINWLFPDIPPQHKANEYIAANMAANILGLGWAATPAGLKAMKELKKLEESNKGNISKKSYTAGNIARMSEDTYEASDMMCAFLVLNISSLQLIPINMIAYRSQYGSVNPTAVVLPAILATMISTLAGILFIKGDRPVKDKKYDLLKHPNIKQTLDGGREPYIHGQTYHFIDDWQNILLTDNEYELLDQEEVEKYVKEIKENEENKNN